MNDYDQNRVHLLCIFVAKVLYFVSYWFAQWYWNQDNCNQPVLLWCWLHEIVFFQYVYRVWHDKWVVRKVLYLNFDQMEGKVPLNHPVEDQVVSALYRVELCSSFSLFFTFNVDLSIIGRLRSKAVYLIIKVMFIYERCIERVFLNS